MRAVVSRSRPTLPDVDHPTLWTCVIAIAFVGDILTTLVGLHLGASEANPVVAGFLESAGIWVLPLLKAVALALVAILYRAMPPRGQVVGLVGVLVAGTYAVANNLAVIAVVIGA